MNCLDLRDWIPELLAGQLSEESVRRCEAHLEHCSGCSLELEQIKAVWTELGELPEDDPSPGLRGRFYAMLEEEKRRAGRAERAPWTKRFEGWVDSWWPRRPVVQLAGVAVVLVVGIVAGTRLESVPRGNGEVSHLRDEVEQMQQMVSLSLLNKESSSDRLQGVNWSTRIAEPSRELLTTLTRTLESDPNVNVRLAAVDALSLFRNEPGVFDALTTALSQESSPSVQVALIDLMTAIQEGKSLDALSRFIEMQNIDPEVKQHAKNQISDFM